MKRDGLVRSVNADGAPGDGIGSYFNEDLSSYSSNVRIEAYAAVLDGKITKVTLKMVTNMFVRT